MVDYLKEVKKVQKISNMNKRVMMAIFTPEFTSVIISEIDRMCGKSRKRLDEMTRLNQKCYAMFKDDREMLVPVLTTVIMNEIATGVLNETENEKQQDNVEGIEVG